MNKSDNRFITCPKFVFLCGKAFQNYNRYKSTNRGIVERYLKSKSQDIFIVLSEKLWEEGFDNDIDLLTFEEFLAEVSDAIILFAESPGSYCELGAFSYADKLFSNKLIIVIDDKYKDNKSFIITGPTAKAKKNGAKVVYASVSSGDLLSSIDLITILDEKSMEFSSKSSSCNKRTPNVNQNSVFVNTFILELLNLIQITQPITRKDLLDLYKRVKGFSGFTFVKSDGREFNNEIKYSYIIKLLNSVGLIDLNGEVISSNLFDKSQQLMFNYTKTEENKERNKLLCRKYRHKGL
ncbi:MAG: retron St85 family effector protein [Clostridia bacterium]|nr:retron St85 family effector protein [Clostridia bacterium]